jgi:translocation and assembly module TamB
LVLPDNEKVEKKAWLRLSSGGFYKRILVFLVLVAGTALVLRPVQLTLQEEMGKARDNFIESAGEFLGLKIKYGSLSPSIFGVLDIRDVLILREDDSVFLSIARLRLSYSLAAIFRGVKIDAFNSIRIDRPVLSLDFVKDAELWERLSSLRKQGSSPAPQSVNLNRLLPENFSCRIWNGESDFADSFGILKLRGLRLDASVRRSRVSFQGRWNAQLALSVDNSSLPSGVAALPLEAVMSGRISGEYSGDLDEGSATVEIPSITGDFFRLKPVSFGFFLSGDQLEIRKIYDRSPAAFSLVYDLGNKKLEGRMEAENLALRDLLTFTGSYRKYNEILAFRVSGSAGLTKDSSDSFQFNMNLSGNGNGNKIFEKASLDVMVSGDIKQVIIDTFDFSSSSGELEFKGGIELVNSKFNQLAPYGLLSLSNFRLHGDRGVGGEIYLSTIGQDITIVGENLSAGDAKLSALDLSIHQEEDGITFALSAFGVKDSKYDSYTRNSTLYIDGSADYDPRQIQANVRMDSFAVGDMLSFVEPFLPFSAIPSLLRYAADDLSVTTEIFFITDYAHVVYDAPRVIASYEGLQDILATVSLSGTDRAMELSAASITWNGVSAEFSGNADFSNRDNISFSLVASTQNLTYSFEGMIQDLKNIIIRGSYGIQVMIIADEFGVRTGYARGDLIPIPSGNKFASLSFLFSVFYDSPEYWRTRIEKFELSGLTTPSSSSALVRFTGEAGEKGLKIPNLFFDDGRGALSGEVSLNWDTAYENYSFKTEIASNNRSEYYALDGEYIDKRLSLKMSGQNMQFSRFSFMNAVADVSLSLMYESPASFEAEMMLPSFAMHRQNEVIRLSADMNVNNDELYAQRLRINYSGLEVWIPYIKIDRTATLAETEAEVWGMISDRPLDLFMRGSATFNSTETWVGLFRNFKFLKAQLTVESAYYSDIIADKPFAFSFDCRKEEDGLSMSLNGGPKDMLRFRLNPDNGGGVFYAALSSPSPVRGSFTGFVSKDSIDAQGSDLYADLNSLWRFFPSSDSVGFSGGIVTASIRVTGSLDDPEFYGTARGTSVKIVVPEYLPEPIRPVPTTFTFSGNEITFGPVDAIVGTGGGKVSGWFRFDQWIPNIFNIDIQVAQETPIPYKLDISGLLASGMASGKIVLSMEDMILSINGDLTAHDTEISFNAGEINVMEGRNAFDSEDSTVSTITNLNIRTGRRVEFFWPSVDFPIIQANADMGTGINVTSDSMAKRFTLNGDVKLRSGEIFYLERNFYIREGTLFFKENEVAFDPKISARAEIRDQSDIGPVTISMIIDEAPLRSFSPRFVSTPPLSQLEIYSLLGQAPQGDGDQRNLVASVAMDSLAQFTVINRLQRQVRDYLGLDMLSMRTQLLQNVVVQAAGAAGNQLTGNTSDRPYRLGNYFDNTTVFVGKFFGTDLFGEAMFSFKYDENKIDWGGLVLEPELGFELRNPLFDIQFNMSLLHPENLFIDDISFSLVWRRSF